MRIISAILIIISGIIINHAVGFNGEVLFGETFLIIGIWLGAWKSFLREYNIDLEGEENHE